MSAQGRCFALAPICKLAVHGAAGPRQTRCRSGDREGGRPARHGPRRRTKPAVGPDTGDQRDGGGHRDAQDQSPRHPIPVRQAFANPSQYAI